MRLHEIKVWQGLTVPDHPHSQTLLETAELAAVPPALVHWAAPGCQTHVVGILLHCALTRVRTHNHNTAGQTTAHLKLKTIKQTKEGQKTQNASAHLFCIRGTHTDSPKLAGLFRPSAPPTLSSQPLVPNLTLDR